MTKKNIDFFVFTFLTGGIETTLLQILQNLNRKKFNARLIILYKTANQEKLIDQVPSYVEIEYVINSNFLNQLRSKRLKQKLIFIEKILEEVFLLNLRRIIFPFRIKKLIQNTDIVVDYSMCLNKYKSIINSKKKFVYCHYSLEKLNRANKSKNKKAINSLLNYDMVITICDEMRNQYIQYHPNHKNNVLRLYNYIDKDYIISKSNEFTPKHKNKYILAIGRLDETQKDYTTLIKAFSILNNKFNKNIDLVVLGDGRDKQKLIELAKKERIDKHIFFKNFVTNPFPWIRHSELFVHSSKFEGLPTVIIESMILNKPIVATDFKTGIKELLLEGKAGNIAPVGDHEKLAEYMFETLEDKNFKEKSSLYDIVLMKMNRKNTILKLEAELLK